MNLNNLYFISSIVNSSDLFILKVFIFEKLILCIQGLSKVGFNMINEVSPKS